MEEEVGVEIPGFPDYEITNFGRVFNVRSGKEMVLSAVTGGALSTGLTKDGKQYRRSVKVLVAKLFVDGEGDIPPEFCPTPMLLDGDEHNVRASNIVWRPRWFAWEYHNQFVDPWPRFYLGPVVAMDSGNYYETVLDAARDYGVLAKHVLMSIYDEILHVPMSGEKFDWAIV